MGITEFEQSLLAYAVAFPKLISTIDPNLLSEEAFQILRLASSINATNAISYPVFIALIGDRWSELNISTSTVADIYDLSSKFTKRSNEEAKTEIMSLLEYMKFKSKQNDAIKKLESAIRLIRNGEVNAGITTAKSVSYEAPENLLSAAQSLMFCLEEKNGFKTGIPKIDKNIGGLATGNILSLVGHTGSMKTMISVWTILRILEVNPDFTALYFEKEMPVQDITRRLIARLTHKPVDQILMLEGSEQGQLVDTVLEYTNKFLNKDVNTPKLMNLLSRFRIVPNTQFDTASDMLMWLEKYKPNVWCLDFMTQLGQRKKKTDFNAFIQDEINTLKDITTSTNTFGMILHQPKKGVDSRADKRLNIDDIEWSGVISQVSAYIWSTYFPSKYYPSVPENYYFLQTLKNRHGKSLILSFDANPEFANFAIPDNMSERAMEDWYYDFHNFKKTAKSTNSKQYTERILNG